MKTPETAASTRAGVALLVLALASLTLSAAVVVRGFLRKRHDQARCDQAGGYWSEGRKLCAFPPTLDCPVSQPGIGRVGKRDVDGWCVVPIDQLPRLNEEPTGSVEAR